jgi:uncharacterized membrane protein YgaE (UPF0421/DUF939 family)
VRDDLAVDAGPEGALQRLRELTRADYDWTGFGPRAWRHTRLSAENRWKRLRSRGWAIAQCASGAAIAWYLAQTVLGHSVPFFAPVAAVVALGMSFQNRLRRVAEIVVGVALGVAVGDLFVRLVGTGAWQIAVVVAIAMTLAVLLDAGLLIVTQAGVQAVIVTTLLPSGDAGLGRWLDAVVGGVVAIVIAAVVPRGPLLRPRRLAATVVDEVAELLAEAARSARDGDVQRATRTLERARGSQKALDQLRGASVEGLELARVSPFRRRHRGPLKELAASVEPLDRAVRNVRVLVRRVVVAAWRREPMSPELGALIGQLAEAALVLAREVAEDEDGPAVDMLKAVAERSSTVELGVSLSNDVVLAQTRSIVVDLMQVAGVSYDEALSHVPPPSPPPPSPPPPPSAPPRTPPPPTP